MQPYLSNIILFSNSLILNVLSIHEPPYSSLVNPFKKLYINLRNETVYILI